MSEGETGRELVEVRGRGKRGHYTVSPRLRVAIEAMATGQAKTITEAADAAQMTREGLSKALRRDSVKSYMRSVIMETLGVGATAAARRMTELMRSGNAMTDFNACRFLLGAGMGVTMPTPAGPLVAISIGEKAGYCIDLREPSDPRPEARWRRPEAVTIEGEVVEDDGDSAA